MVLKNIKQLLKTTGILVGFNHFKDHQECPYILINIPRERAYGADTGKVTIQAPLLKKKKNLEQQWHNFNK